MLRRLSSERNTISIRLPTVSYFTPARGQCSASVLVNCCSAFSRSSSLLNFIYTTASVEVMSSVCESRKDCAPTMAVVVCRVLSSVESSSRTRRSFSCSEMPRFQSMVIIVSSCGMSGNCSLRRASNRNTDPATATTKTPSTVPAWRKVNLSTAE